MSKTLITVQDLSCVGRCSLTVALPVLACLGIETYPLPTALLSSHTGFDKPFKKNLTTEMAEILSHWEPILKSVDAVYIGYLAQSEQLPLVKKLIDRYKNKGAKIYIDPVMGDGGKRYKSISEEQCEALVELCFHADWIFPNRTEAALLLNIPFDELPSNTEILKALRDKFDCNVVLTGIKPTEDKIGAYLKTFDSSETVFHPYIAGSFPGTGDLFASVFIASVINGINLKQALLLAAHFVYRCIKRQQGDIRFGVPFEQELNYLITNFQKILSEEKN
ncbi:MAG: PfkB family carbohydrate kinase [Eubacteriales bacterium]|nr:PfkB family carbohydrate kinase [Eubacteriales bacterium]